MKNKRTLGDKMRDLGGRAVDTMKTGAKVAVGGLILYTLASHNGCNDSYRTNEARRLQGESTKTVATIEETWKDNIVSSPTLDGYNPRVIRKVTFEDGTQTTLDYRTLAHQPFRRWIAGEEFNPQVGEAYKVTKNNQLVKKIE